MIEHVLVHTPNKFFGACTEWGSGFDSSEIPNFILGVLVPQNFQRLCIKHQPTMIYCHSSTENILSLHPPPFHPPPFIIIIIIIIIIMIIIIMIIHKEQQHVNRGCATLHAILSSTKCNRRCFRYSLTKDLSLAIRLGWSGMKTYCWWKKSG